MFSETVTCRPRGGHRESLSQVQEEQIYPPSSAPDSHACSENYVDSTVGAWRPWTQSTPVHCTQCHLKVDELNPWYQRGSTQYEPQTVDPPCTLDIDEDWLGWDYGTAAEFRVLEPLQTLQLGQSTSCTSCSPGKASDDSYVLASDGGTSDRSLSYADSLSFSPPHSRGRPSQRGMLSSTSTATTMSTGSQLQSTSPLATAQEQDGQTEATRAAIPMENSPSRQITPTSSVSSERKTPNRSKRRKISSEVKEQDEQPTGHKSRAFQMAGHSVTEKRYRTKLNDQLATLRNKVPSLRIVPKRSEEYAYREGREKLERPEASNKFDKATIVLKAIEYITYLELCNKRLGDEHLALKDGVNAIQQIATSGLHRS